MVRSYHRCVLISTGDTVEGPDRLFFALASETRLSILEMLLAGDLRMQEVARRADITATEALRQLTRMSEALLVRKTPDSTYAITSYGRLVMRLSVPLGLAFRHREYFIGHDVEHLPREFVNRLEDLSGTELIMNTMLLIGRVEQTMVEAEEYAWAMAEGDAPAVISSAMEVRLGKGIHFRLLINEDRLPARATPLPGNMEVRSMHEIPAVMILTEKEAGICLRSLDGRTDYTGFLGSEPMFRDWIRDVFLHYWDKARRV